MRARRKFVSGRERDAMLAMEEIHKRLYALCPQEEGYKLSLEDCITYVEEFVRDAKVTIKEFEELKEELEDQRMEANLRE